MDSSSILDILSRHGHKRVGVKLADSGEFEGVEAISPHWSDLAQKQKVPPVVLAQLQSPDLVVVRAAHEDMSLKAYLQLLNRPRGQPPPPRSSGSTAYVEYQSLTYHPGLLRDLLGVSDGVFESDESSQSSQSESDDSPPPPSPSSDQSDQSTSMEESASEAADESTSNESTSTSTPQSQNEAQHLPVWLRESTLGAKAHLWLGDGRTTGKLHFGTCVCV